MSKIKDAARWYAGKGFSVMPISVESKVPAWKWKEYQDRPMSLEEIDKWPEDGVNVGIVTGKVSGVAVIDCDSIENALWFHGRTGGSPLTVRTRRGAHFYFRHPGERVQNAVNAWGRFDIRGDGGYVLAPPSTHADGEYRFSKGFVAPADLPEFKMVWCPPVRESRGASAVDDVISDGRAYISKIVATEGCGANADSFRAACVLRESGIPELEAYVALYEWNKTNVIGRNGQCHPWPSSMLAHFIKGAYA